MQFTSIKANLASATVKQCQEKLTTLVMELACRKDNYHVGSGRGGNNFQMLALLGMEHHLSNADISIASKKNKFIWGTDFILDNSISSIRKELDKAFEKVEEHGKLMALMFLSPTNIAEVFNSYEDNFPILKDIFSNKRSGDFKNFAPYQQITIAFIMCAKYSFELDNKIKTNTKTVGQSLATLSPEVILLAIRKYIGIERIVNHSLDEHPSWENIFTSINRRVN